jgi:nucleotidyltransferase substrate binding protein (TIGR01987 family)
MLDLSGLDNAVAALRSAFQIYDVSPLREDAKEKILLRDGVIQRFEFTFELSWKMLKRFLEQYALEQVDALSNRDLFRVGFEKGLLPDPVKWFYYLKMRNQTSHLYDDAKAREVFDAARDFLPDAQSLFEQLRGKAQ